MWRGQSAVKDSIIFQGYVWTRPLAGEETTPWEMGLHHKNKNYIVTVFK